MIKINFKKIFLLFLLIFTFTGVALSAGPVLLRYQNKEKIKVDYEITFRNNLSSDSKAKAELEKRSIKNSEGVITSRIHYFINSSQGKIGPVTEEYKYNMRGFFIEDERYDIVEDPSEKVEGPGINFKIFFPDFPRHRIHQIDTWQGTMFEYDLDNNRIRLELNTEVRNIDREKELITLRTRGRDVQRKLLFLRDVLFDYSSGIIINSRIRIAFTRDDGSRVLSEMIMNKI
ncbi:MAG: hypothetical protein ACQESP_03515 [Candidatus Muiribacteriota bacterium]